MTNTSGNKSIEFPCKGNQHNSHTLADYINKRCYYCDWEDVPAVLTKSIMEEKKIDKEWYIMRIDE
jgi:hypothetical protein